MLNLRELYSGKRGFTLIELVVGIAIMSILLSSTFSILYFSTRSTKQGDDMDLLLFNSRYAIEYIKGEVMSADKIISSSKFKDYDSEYPNNIGFVVMEEEASYINKDKKAYTPYDDFKTTNYKYISYYQKDNELVRIAYTTHRESFFDGNEFSGHNQISQGIMDISNTFLDIENNTIKLQIEFYEGDRSLDLQTLIYLRCPMD